MPHSTRFWDSSILLDKAINLLAEVEQTSPEEIKLEIQSLNNSVESVESASNRLTGETLLQKLNGLMHLPERELARISGYYTVTKTNQTCINLSDFYDALLAAKGLFLDRENPKNGLARQPKHRVKVDNNGQITICASQIQAMGLKPGDQFEIELGYKQISLFRLEDTQSKQSIQAGERET
ncbi:AbrB family transcriptional regulator [Aliterella atlantica]|uniref:AbrB family transcriptional regulator n=1 Tax=Aliterella atlantica TaxID=1827278 RepID=UPI001F48BDC2|nr:AbrB family transcriptional regulator [Aliterella atlantica]